MSLQFVSISAGIAAKTALEWTLSGVGANVALQFTHLCMSHTSINVCAFTHWYNCAHTLFDYSLIIPLHSRSHTLNI